MGFNSGFKVLTLILLTWRIWWAPNNASKWQVGFNSAFKGLRQKLWVSQWDISFVTWKEAIQLGLLYNQSITSYDTMVNPYYFQITYRFTTTYTKIQGDQKSLCTPDDYNTESYKYYSKCPPTVSRHLLTCRTVFSKTVFSIARSTFRIYSVMAIFKSSIFVL